jgi:hypothetical protein
MADEDTPTQPDDMKYEEFGYADLMQRRETVARFLRDIPNQPLTLAAVTLVVIEANRRWPRDAEPQKHVRGLPQDSGHQRTRHGKPQLGRWLSESPF